MANIKEIPSGAFDASPYDGFAGTPLFPSVVEMRASQEAGRSGKGTQSQDYSQMQACLNMGTGKDGEPDKTSYPRWSNDEFVAEYPDGDGDLY